MQLVCCCMLDVLTFVIAASCSCFALPIPWSRVPGSMTINLFGSYFPFASHGKWYEQFPTNPTICSLCISSHNAFWWMHNIGKPLLIWLLFVVKSIVPTWTRSCCVQLSLAMADADSGSMLPCFLLHIISIFGLSHFTVSCIALGPTGWSPFCILYSFTSRQVLL